MMIRSLNLSKCLFSIISDSSNIRMPKYDSEDNKQMETNFKTYNSQLYQAYVNKRKLSREQISGKMHIIQNIPSQQEAHLKYQELYTLKNIVSEQTMQKQIKQDPSNMNSSYIIGIFSQRGFKKMIDQYVSKVIICGKAPKNQLQMVQVQNQVIDLYRTFYYGQTLTKLQRQIQTHYLIDKNKKVSIYHQMALQGAAHKLIPSKWRQQDQRLKDNIVNWRRSDIQMDDTNCRSYFEPMQLLSRIDAINRFGILSKLTSFSQKWRFNRDIRSLHTITQDYYMQLANKIFFRIYEYINSIQFSSKLSIPPDFMIEMSLYHIHVWLICQRLNQLDTRDSRYLAKIILERFKLRVEGKASDLNVKKENILVRNLNKMINNANVLRLHFHVSNITKNNHYRGIDALVWSLLFHQKVQRYADQVYFFSEYLLKNYQMLQNYNQQDLMNGMIEFDVYFNDPKYKQIVQKVNPPMNKQQFEAQFDSDKLQKAYHYAQIQKNVKIPLDHYKKMNDNLQISWGQMFSPITKFFKTNDANDKKAQKANQNKVQNKLKSKRKDYSNLQ